MSPSSTFLDTHDWVTSSCSGKVNSIVNWAYGLDLTAQLILVLQEVFISTVQAFSAGRWSSWKPTPRVRLLAGYVAGDSQDFKQGNSKQIICIRESNPVSGDMPLER